MVVIFRVKHMLFTINHFPSGFYETLFDCISTERNNLLFASHVSHCISLCQSTACQRRVLSRLSRWVFDRTSITGTCITGARAFVRCTRWPAHFYVLFFCALSIPFLVSPSMDPFSNDRCKCAMCLWEENSAELRKPKSKISAVISIKFVQYWLLYICLIFSGFANV